MSRGWLAPLTPVYGAAAAAKNLAYERGWLKAERLRFPVVSIGNIAAGGTGKTPLAIRLSELLTAEGFAVDVLSRGYGRTSQATERVDPAGAARRFGDEPLLIARRAGIPVYVGASRYEAGRLAEASIAPSRSETSQPVVHLLDDGFQHRRLARDIDVVLLHRTDFTDRLLPAGDLREPLRALRRADFVVLPDHDTELEPLLRQQQVSAPIWWAHRSLSLPADLISTTERVVAFCGIARPKSFFSGLIAQGINLELTVAFADHHPYSRDDADRLVKVATQVRADAFVITEKDEVKLDASLLQLLQSVAPVRVAKLEVSLEDEPAIVRQIKERLASVPSAG